MKTINIKKTEIVEVIFRPSDSSLSILYKIKDDKEEVITEKRVVINKSEFQSSILTNLLNAVLSKTNSKENL